MVATETLAETRTVLENISWQTFNVFVLSTIISRSAP